MKDPVTRSFRRPLRDRITFWVAAVAVAVASGSAGYGIVVSGRVSSEARNRTQQLQDVICQVYVPIANAPISVRVSDLGRTIVAATHHGAVSIHCPGIK